MPKDNTKPQCPFCGHEASHPTKVNLDLLRAAVMYQIIPAMAHSAKAPLHILRNSHRRIKRELGSHSARKINELLEEDERLLRLLIEFMRNLQGLSRIGGRDEIVSLDELLDHLQWFSDLCEFPGPVDFTPLRRIQGHISFQLYLDAYCFAVQGALFAIRRDRRPNIRIYFNIRQEDLITTLNLTHDSLPELDPMAWRALRWLIYSVDGTVSIQAEENSTSVSWALPITS